jgi:chromosome partitioning protein
MRVIIAVASRKGGVGKTTTAQAVGVGLRRKGFSVLFVDLDAQGNLTHALGGVGNGMGSWELLTGRAGIGNVLQTTGQGPLIASSPALAGANATPFSEYRLREVLHLWGSRYNAIIVDTPPSLGILTVNALVACAGVLVPAQADVYSLQSIVQLGTELETIRRHGNPGLTLLGIVLTRHSARTVLGRDMAETMANWAERLGTTVFRTKIRECVALREAQALRKDIFTHAPKSRGAEDYRALVEEIWGRMHGAEKL